MTVAVCFIRRTADGLALTGARWVDLRGEQSTTHTPAAKAVDDPRGGIAHLAQWIITQCQASPGNPEVLLVLDSDGSSCGWLTASGREPELVSAAVRDVLAESDEDSPASLDWMGTWVGDSEPGAAVSVQALTNVATTKGQANDDGKADVARKSRHRLALLAVPDVSVRLLLDRIDQDSGGAVRVRRTITLWHAMAQVQGAAGKPGPSRTPQLKVDDRIVADIAPTETHPRATIIIDDHADGPAGSDGAGGAGGQLLWTWSAPGAEGGGLLCAGTLLLREAIDRPTPTSRATTGLRLSSGTDDDADEQPSATSARVVSVSRADLGRLTAEWLGWSMQLGVAPGHVTIAGPSTVTCVGLPDDLPATSGVGAVGSAIARAWPGCRAEATMQEDPIGAVLRRLVDIENDGGTLPAGPMAVDPRASVTDLSTRPGRATRALHLWGALAMFAGAAGIGVLGMRLNRSAGDLQAATQSAIAERAELISELRSQDKVTIPADAPDPVAIVRSRINGLNEQRREMRAEEPLLAELSRVLTAARDIPGLELRSLSLESAGMLNTAEFLVTGDAGPTFLERVRATRSGAPREVPWDGRTAGTEGNRRRFNVSGRAFSEAPKTGSTTPPPLAPAPAPTPAPAPEASSPALATPQAQPTVATEPASEPAPPPAPQPAPQPAPVP